MNITRTLAIFEKDLKDFMKNMMLLTMPIIPIILAVLYSRMFGEEIPLFSIYLIVGIAFSGVTSNCIMIMMAEEKEKLTLRSLMMSPASFTDIIVGKSLVTTLITLITLVASLWIIGAEALMTLQGVLGLILLFFFFLFLGLGVGLITKTVAMTSFYMMPIMFLFGFTPMFNMVGLGEDHWLITVIDTFPIPQVIEMQDSGSWSPLLIVFIWIIVAIAFCVFSYQKNKTDD